MSNTFNDFLNFVRPTPHSKYGPSSAERWLETGCQGSTNASKNIPSETSIYAEEGTLAHTVCEHTIRKRHIGLDFPAALNFELATKTKDTGIEMEHCAMLYADVVDYWLGNKEQIGDVIWWGLEKGVPVYPELGCFGTADALVIGTKGTAVIDFKYGRGKAVSADTVQLKVYAAGVAKHIPLEAGKEYNYYTVVHQPRINETPSEFKYTHQELIDFLVVIKRSIEKSELPDAPLNEGNHCFWCPARRTNDRNLKCPIKLEKPLKLAQENFDKFLSDSHKASLPDLPRESSVDFKKRDEAIIKLLSLYPAIKSVVEEAEKEFKERIELGEAIEGVRIENVMGKRQLNGDSDEDKAALIRQVDPSVDPYDIVPASACYEEASHHY